MSVETEVAKPTDPYDPAASPLKHFGVEVRLERERVGMTRAELGKLAHCGYSLVAKIEVGERVPIRDFAETCDVAFPDTHGRFVRLWKLALRYAFPLWFRPYVDLESVATVVRMFNPQLVPGLVQTEEYARAVLRVGRPTNLADLVTMRMERQRILTREVDPARLWIILDEAVLRNTVGSPAVMGKQLTRLRELAETPQHRVQIVRTEGPLHGGTCPWSLLSFSEGADVVHVDGFPRGYILAEPDDVETVQDAYDLLKAMALPPAESVELIDSISKDCYS